MKQTPYQDHLRAARKAAFAAGKILAEKQKSAHSPLLVDQITAHDIKLELDRQLQDLIVKILLEATPQASICGEEGSLRDQTASQRWIIDPIDGTVNLFFGIPHYSISIAFESQGKIMAGVIYDPIRDELWQAERDEKVTLNNEPIQVSNRSHLEQSVIALGMSKENSGIQRNLPQFNKMVQKALKCRLMGSAALDLAYIATGRLDAYIDAQINLWDIAAGMLLVEMAGGKIAMAQHPHQPEKYAVIASNGNIPLPSLEEILPSLKKTTEIKAS